MVSEIERKTTKLSKHYISTSNYCKDFHIPRTPSWASPPSSGCCWKDSQFPLPLWHPPLLTRGEGRGWQRQENAVQLLHGSDSSVNAIAFLLLWALLRVHPLLQWPCKEKTCISLQEYLGFPWWMGKHPQGGEKQQAGWRVWHHPSADFHVSVKPHVSTLSASMDNSLQLSCRHTHTHTSTTSSSGLDRCSLFWVSAAAQTHIR